MNQKQGSGYGYSGVRGLNALFGIVSTPTAAPIIIGSRLRKGAAGSPRGAGKFVADILATVGQLRSAVATGVVLMDEGEDLAGGNSNVVTRVGQTVRRSAGPWTPAIYAFLEVLQSAGITEVRKTLGTLGRPVGVPRGDRSLTLPGLIH